MASGKTLEIDNYSLSKYMYILCLVLVSYTSFVYYPRWNKMGTESTISCDVAGYYWYLPAIFIYIDLKHLTFCETIFDKYHPVIKLDQSVRAENGNSVLKYTSGMALMYLPFFLLGHVAAIACGFPQDGFSLPYQLAIQLGGFLISILGLWYLRKLLLLYYKDGIVALALLLLVVGTNYTNVAFIDCGMSHGWLFTIYVFILLNTRQLYATFKFKYAIRVGLLIGLAALSRPTEAISCLIPLLWGLEAISLNELRRHLGIISKHIRLLLVAVCSAALVVSIQLVYWRYTSGHWLVYSYGDQRLYFKSPSFYNYTFSYLSGWLRYTPTMVLAFIGLIPFLIKGQIKAAILVFFLLNYYIVCCWQIWWFGGRAMVQSYPVLFFPICSLLTYVFQVRLLKLVFIPLVLVCSYLNIWFFYQCHTGGLYDNFLMTGPYYWNIVGRWNVPRETALLKDGAELFSGTAYNQQVVWQHDMEQDTGCCMVLPGLRGNKSFELDERSRWPKEYKFASTRKGTWLRFSALVHCFRKDNNLWQMAEQIGTVYYQGQMKKQNLLRLSRVINVGETKKIDLYMNVSSLTYDSVSIGFYNAVGNNDFLIDNIEVVSFDSKK